MSKFTLLFVLSTLTISIFSQTLEEQVDNLTPEQANRILNKLNAKRVEPIPVELFTKLSLTVSMGIQSNKQDQFYSTLDSKFRDDDNHEMPGYSNISLLWHLKEHYRLGFSFGRFSNELRKEVSSNLFKEVELNGDYFQLEAARLFRLSDRWSVSTNIGLGALKAKATILASNDSNSQSYNYNYEGEDLFATFKTSLNYSLNSIFHIGLESGYVYNKVDDLKRSGETDISNPNELDFSGVFWGLRLVSNL